MCIYIYNFFSHSLSWSPLFLDAIRKTPWYPQSYLPYHTPTHRKMQNHTMAEEATVEPTPPLKRIYTLPSIKVLFPLNQCKSLFRKFKTNSIKTYTSQYNKNMIHNLSNHKLTDHEFSVLIKGLFFVPTPTKTFKQKTYKCWDKFKTRMLTQYFFRSSTHDKPPPI